MSSYDDNKIVVAFANAGDCDGCGALLGWAPRSHGRPVTWRTGQHSGLAEARRVRRARFASCACDRTPPV